MLFITIISLARWVPSSYETREFWNFRIYLTSKLSCIGRCRMDAPTLVIPRRKYGVTCSLRSSRLRKVRPNLVHKACLHGHVFEKNLKSKGRVLSYTSSNTSTGLSCQRVLESEVFFPVGQACRVSSPTAR